MLSTSSSVVASKQPPAPRAMTFDPYLANSAAAGDTKVPEFLRPLPKPAARYTGEANNFMPNYGNGVRMMSKLPSYQQHHPTAAEEAAAAVNLMHKHQMQYFPSHAYTPLYFNSAMPHQFSLQQRPMAFSFGPKNPPGQLLLADSRPPPPQQKPPPPPPQQQPPTERPPFKMPSGKEGSMKHRILTRPEPDRASGLDRRRSQFSRGSLIKLTQEKVIKIEDIRTEDFIFAAEKCPALRLDPSTVVRISENAKRPQEAMIVLRYGPDQQQQTVEMEVVLEHPFFVYGKGWSSISPEKTLSLFDLPCVRLSVGDTCISLSPRPPPLQLPPQLPPSAGSLKRRWSAPAAENLLDQDCPSNPQPPPAQRTKLC